MPAPLTSCLGPPARVSVTSWPLVVTILLCGMPGLWPGRPRFVRCWLLGTQALFPGRKTFGGVGPLDAGLAYGLALALHTSGDLLEGPSAGGVVGAGSLLHLAIGQGRNAVSRGRRQCEMGGDCS